MNKIKQIWILLFSFGNTIGTINSASMFLYDWNIFSIVLNLKQYRKYYKFCCVVAFIQYSMLERSDHLTSTCKNCKGTELIILMYLFPFRFFDQNIMCASHLFQSPMHATCPTHLISDLIILVIFCNKYKLWSCSVHNSLHLVITSSLMGSNILLSTLFWNTPAYAVSHLFTVWIEEQSYQLVKKSDYCLLYCAKDYGTVTSR
jgi:hypothetical protein